MYCAGLDAGSRAVKCVVIDRNTGEVAASALADQGVHQQKLAQELYDRTLRDAGIAREAVGRVVATGYGRNLLDFADTTITEITCHARGVHHVLPQARTVVDIGGQDSKLIRLDDGGAVRDFAMNDRCAAGTGRFLEVVAQRLEVPLEKLGEMARRAARPAPISSMCVVFAETEIIGLLASGTSAEEIVAGVQHSIATRLSSMAGRKVDQPVAFTGGVALVPGMIEALEQTLEAKLIVPEAPQMTGALGAALLACR